MEIKPTTQTLEFTCEVCNAKAVKTLSDFEKLDLDDVDACTGEDLQEWLPEEWTYVEFSEDEDAEDKTLICPNCAQRVRRFLRTGRF